MLEVASPVLFVCTGNISRSPFAERYLAKLAHERGISLEVSSAGTHALIGQPASAEARSAAEEFGVDLGPHLSRRLELTMLEQARVVICMEDIHAGVVETLMITLDEADRPEIVVLNVADPYGESRAFHHARFAEIADSCVRLLDGRPITD